MEHWILEPISVFLFIGVIDMILVSMEGLKGRVFFRH